MHIEKYQDLLTINWNLLFSVITVLALFFILKHFFFEKVHNFMVEREKSISDALENADKTSKLADEKLINYEAKIANVEQEGRLIIKSARDEAKNQASEIVEKANEKARMAIEHSQKEIRREKYNARKELQGQVGALAVLAAEQILEKELSTDKQQEIVEQIIKDAGDAPWQN